MADTPGAGFAPAKVNLALHVVGQRDDGLHLLDSLVAFADIGDRLNAAAAEASSLRVTGPMAAGVPTGDSNLILKAAAWMGIPAAFTLDKCLPAAAGIGGGSSDAAAALRLLSGLSGKPVPPGAEALGADVPVCLLARAARMQGIGEAVAPVALPPLPCILANPRAAVPTGPVFAALARKDNPGLPAAVPAFADVADAAAWLARQRNDLEPPARRLEPVIDVVLKTLAALPGALLTRMSGSGATCFALFATQPEAVAAAHTLRRAHPGWWVADTLLS